MSALDFFQKTRDAFWNGLTSASAVSWMGALAFCAMEIIACCIFARPRFLARAEPLYLMETRGDDYCQLTIKLMRLKRSNSKLLQVAYVGASQATRALFDHDNPDLSRELSRSLGEPARFNLLSTNNQRFEDDLGISDQLPRNYRGAFVMIVNDYKDDYKTKNAEKLRVFKDRIAFESAPSLLSIPKAAENQAQPTTGIFFLDHLGFFAARRIAALRLGEALPRPANAEAHAARVAERLERLKNRPDQVEESRQFVRAPILSKSRAVIQRLIHNMKKRGVLVVFVENPEAPARNYRFETRVEKFKGDFAEFAEDNGCTFWDFNPDLDLVQEDFSDDVHLASPTARRRFQGLLMDHLADLFHSHFDAEDGTHGEGDDVQNGDAATPAKAND